MSLKNTVVILEEISFALETDEGSPTRERRRSLQLSCSSSGDEITGGRLLPSVGWGEGMADITLVTSEHKMGPTLMRL